MTQSFGARMRSHRERRGIGIDAVARSTKIGVPILEAIERDDVSRLPSGIFRRAFIRAYAAAVGLDPEWTLGEFLERFPDPDGGNGPNAPAAPRSAPGAPLRLMLADEPWQPSLRAPWPRIGAAVCDLAIVLALAAALFPIAGRFWTCLAVATVGYYFGGVLLVGASPAASVIGRRQRAHVADPPPQAIDQIGRAHV